MNIFYYIIVFFVGACFVSCGNCIRYRVERGMDWVKGRSVCERCGRTLKPWELIPVISCLALRAKCHKCGYKFGALHAWTEACGGVLAIALFHFIPAYEFKVLCVFVYGVAFCVCNWVVGKLYRSLNKKL